MTRKDRAAIATIIHQRTAKRRTPTLTALAHEIADYCEQDRPGFDRDKFLIACGVRRTRRPT